jgi:hypothetical protein
MARFTFLPVAFGGRGAGRRPAGRRVPRLILPRADRGRIFSCPALARVRFSPPAIGAKRLLPAAFWGFQDSENLVKAPPFGGRVRNLPSKIPPQSSFRAEFPRAKIRRGAATGFRPATAQRSHFPSRNARSQHNSNAFVQRQCPIRRRPATIRARPCTVRCSSGKFCSFWTCNRDSWSSTARSAAAVIAKSSSNNSEPTADCSAWTAIPQCSPERPASWRTPA